MKGLKFLFRKVISIRNIVRRAFTDVDARLKEIKEPELPDNRPSDDFNDYVMVNGELELVAECLYCKKLTPIKSDPESFSIKRHCCKTDR